jgi:hypothetical protein
LVGVQANDGFKGVWSVDVVGGEVR